MFTKEEEKKLRAELVETYEYQKTSAAIQYYKDDYNSAPILDMADVSDAFEAGADWYKKLVENKGELTEPNVGVEWIDAKKRLPLPNEQEEYLIAVKNKNKENGIWLYDIAFWNSEEFVDKHTLNIRNRLKEVYGETLPRELDEQIWYIVGEIYNTTRNHCAQVWNVESKKGW